MGNFIKVAFCIDKAYMQHLAVSLVSLYHNNRADKIKTYIIAPQLSLEEKEKLDIVCRPFGAKLIFMEIDSTCFSNLREHLHLSRGAYYRLFLPNILSDENKVIYFDCDTVIESDLQDLWNMDVANKACAGWDEEEQAHIDRLDLDGDFYINSGVMVINLEYWRQNKLTERCMQWLQDNPEKNILLDQDAMNVVTKGAKARIEQKWNLNPLPKESIDILLEYPSRVIHFAGPVKPWQKWYDFDLQAIYWRYLYFTPWYNSAVLEEPRNFCQSLSVASQYYKKQDYVNACKYYQSAIKFRIESHQIESLLILDCINHGHRLYNNRDYYNSCELYQSCIKSWGYPVDYKFNIYKLGQGILG